MEGEEKGGQPLMNISHAVPTLTTQDLLALPRDDSVTRYLIRGQLREVPMTKRNRWHTRLEARIAQLLGNWLDQQPEPRGEVFAGEVGCILRHNPDTTVGIDVVYAGHDVATRESKETTLLDGIPILAVEILSPSTTQEELNERIDEFLAVGVPLLWLVDPHLRTVLVLRPGKEPELFNVNQELSGEPQLPGFRVPVSRIFRR
jgi:Uma2 family endonuclease